MAWEVIANLVLSRLWGPLSRQIHYIMDLEKNMQTLRTKREQLSALHLDVGREVERTRLQPRMIVKEVVKIWLENVSKVQGPLEEIEKEYGDNPRCLKRCLPDWLSRRSLGKRSLALIEQVSKLIEEGRSYNDSVAVDELPTTSNHYPTTTLTGATANEAFQLIWRYLLDDEIVSIGVHGMGGIGKTTIMKNINSHLAAEEKIFDQIIMVTVSQDLNIRTLQDCIAKQIKLELPDDQAYSSSQLYEALLKRRKLLVILDDLWSSFSLEEVGIPKPSIENGCKLATISRSEDVCRRMEAQKYVKVRVFSPEDAWFLFKEKVGPNALQDSTIEDIAREVVEECGGLPLAIVTVGLALRDESNLGVWRNALNQLKNSSTDLAGVEDKVIEKLKYSYSRLRNDKLRDCFLYGALFPEDRDISKSSIVVCWVWEGLFDNQQNEGGEFDAAEAALNELIRAGMLEECGMNCNGIRMHDLIRDMAISITREEPRFMIKVGKGLEKTPESEFGKLG